MYVVESLRPLFETISLNPPCIKQLSREATILQITPDLLREVEQFLYREARLLDNRQFHQWVELLAEDVRYWMPMRSNIYPANSKAIASLDEARQEAQRTDSTR